MEPPRFPVTRRQALRLGAGLAAAPLLGGCAADPDDGVAGAADSSGIQRLLQARAAAVLHRDRTALLATVDPAATGLRATQAQLLPNLAQVPLAGWEYRLLAVGAFPLPAQAVGGGSRPAARVAAQVQLRYRLAGYDTQPVTATQYWTLVRRGGDWLLASDTDGAASGHTGDSQLWDLGPVRAVRGASCLVLGLRQDAPLRQLAAVADRAVPAVSTVWGNDWAGRTVLLAPSALDEFGALLDADPRAYQSIAAVTTGELGAHSAPADRIIVNPQAYDGLSDFGRGVVLTHETTHVATRAITTAATPRWLAEGAADWTAYLRSGRPPKAIAPELAADLAAGRVPVALPTDDEFASTAGELPQAYEKAWLACCAVAARGGAAAVPAVYRGVAARGSVDGALRGVIGMGLDEFTTFWRKYLQTVL